MLEFWLILELGEILKSITKYFNFSIHHYTLVTLFIQLTAQVAFWNYSSLELLKPLSFKAGDR